MICPCQKCFGCTCENTECENAECDEDRCRCRGVRPKPREMPKVGARRSNVRWSAPREEDTLEVVSIKTGAKYLIDRADHAFIGTEERVAVVEKTDRGYLERIFVGKYLEFVERLVIARRTASWDVSVCPEPENGECPHADPHITDHSERISRYEVGGIASRMHEHGYARYSITKIDDRGVWGTYAED